MGPAWGNRFCKAALPCYSDGLVCCYLIPVHCRVLHTCVQSCAGSAPALLNAPVLAHKPTSSQGFFGKASHAELRLNIITRSEES